MRTLSSVDFKTMPWKNGGGSTCELYRHPDPNHSEDFLFRLSRAEVNSSGPFSLFPGIDRTLLLLKGKGFILNQDELSQTLSPIYFAGEKAIHCELIDGACYDFNVMVKRNWAKTKVEVKQLILGEVIRGDFIYLPTKHMLICLETDEAWSSNTTDQAIIITLELHSTSA